MSKLKVILVICFLCTAAAKAELIEASSQSQTTTTTETVDAKQSSTEIPAGAVEVTPTVDSPEEIRRIQQEQLKMIMRLHKAEDLRNAEIRKRHDAAIKTLEAKGLKSPFAQEVKSSETVQTPEAGTETKAAEENKNNNETSPKKKSFWQKIFGIFSSDKEVNPAAIPAIEDDF